MNIIILSNKLILLVDKGMELLLDLPIYSYVLKDDKFKNIDLRNFKFKEDGNNYSSY